MAGLGSMGSLRCNLYAVISSSVKKERTRRQPLDPDQVDTDFALL